MFQGSRCDIFELSGEAFVADKKMDNETILDLDKNGKIIGIELLNVSKRIAKDFLSDFKNALFVPCLF